MTESAGRPLVRLLADHSVAICCGSGGVGKTTTAAALGLAGAFSGKRTCVVTIDPARRLADALDTEDSLDVPHRVDGPWTGELYALMLDAKSTFDSLVNNNAGDPEQADRILQNRLYKNLVTALSGTQEYMATEKLYELHNSGLYDLVIVDTPPTPQALDFLDSPRRLASFLNNRIFAALLSPGRGYVRALSMASQLLLRTIGKIAGSEIVDDAIAFFQAFEGMEEGFKERAESVDRLLAEAQTAFVLVTTPRRDAIIEATAFAERLDELHHRFDALIVNRMHPDFGDPIDLGESTPAGPWHDLIVNLDDLATLAHREEELVADLVGRVAPAPVVRVPMLESDVHDLSGLTEVAEHLLR